MVNHIWVVERSENRYGPWETEAAAFSREAARVAARQTPASYTRVRKYTPEEVTAA